MASSPEAQVNILPPCLAPFVRLRSSFHHNHLRLFSIYPKEEVARLHLLLCLIWVPTSKDVRQKDICRSFSVSLCVSL